MILGCDGGFYATYDRGANWDHLNALALGQFYHVAVDNRKPYRVYGGLAGQRQLGRAERTLRGTGPVERGLAVRPRRRRVRVPRRSERPGLVYSESQGGAIGRRNLRTGEQGGVRPRRVKEDEELRFNWNTPFILSSHNSQHLLLRRAVRVPLRRSGATT